MLKQMGYSEKAVSEILKWYNNNSLQAEKRSEGSLRSGIVNQQKSKG